MTRASAGGRANVDRLAVGKRDGESFGDMAGVDISIHVRGQ